MLFAAIFVDKQDHQALRAEYLAAHIAWIKENKDKILVAGSLRNEPSEVPKGGLWVIEAESKEFVSNMMKTDPFYTCGLRQSIELLYWSKALPDHKVLV